MDLTCPIGSEAPGGMQTFQPPHSLPSSQPLHFLPSSSQPTTMATATLARFCETSKKLQHRIALSYPTYKISRHPTPLSPQVIAESVALFHSIVTVPVIGDQIRHVGLSAYATR